MLSRELRAASPINTGRLSLPAEHQGMQFTTLMHDRAQIYLLFYKPSADDPFLNKMVAYFNGPYCHVELAFPEKYGDEPWEKEMLGTSIYQGETIFFKPKTYQRDGYFSFAIEVSQAQRIKIKDYCRVQSERNVPFSKAAMYLAYLPVQIMHLEGTFCSKHVTNALLAGQVEGLKHLNPNLVTPSSLYRTMLQKSMESPIVQVFFFKEGVCLIYFQAKGSSAQVIPCRMSQDCGQNSAHVLKEIIVSKTVM